MNWLDLAQIQRTSAGLLAKNADMARPGCGRAYYAVYSLIAHRLLPAKITYAHGWNNPAHADLPKYVSHLSGLGPFKQQAVRKALRRLRQRREDADYRPGVTVDRASLRESLRDAAEVFRILLEED